MLSWTRALKPAIAITCLLTPWTGTALAEGVSAYLPLNLEPEMERQIERVLILADEPILKRPFAVGLVQAALPQACLIDKPLCTRVKRYLQRYSHDYGVTHASATGSVTHNADNAVMPNAHGMPVKSPWELSLQAYVQPSDYLLVSAGAVAYDGRTVPVGSMLSFGLHWAQIDIGYRDHWFSPATDSSMLISTEAPTTLSVTLSNSEPLTRLGFQYEFFASQLSHTDHILYQGRLGSGDPRIFGAQFSIEPFSGWSLGVNRLLEYGGGNGLPDGTRILLRNFFKPSGLAQFQGNQQASYISRFIFPGKNPFAVYFQYAGEDNSNGGSYLLGNAALTAGIDMPRIGRYFDVTYEFAEWQNAWYVHSIFLDGMTNDGLVLGNWGADQRNFRDGVGARSHMLRIGWEPPFGGYLEERIRTLQNQSDGRGGLLANSPVNGAFPYHRYYDVMVRYSRPWRGVTVGGEAFGGRDVYGETFARLSAFVRYGGEERARDDGTLDEDSSSGNSRAHGAELFVDAGISVNQVRVDLEPGLPITTGKWQVNPHLGVGARRAVTANNDLGVRLELDEAQGHALIGVRAVDYRYRFTDSLALGLFLGAARYDLVTPAYSVYYGIGGLWRNVLPKWDLGLDIRHDQNLARDHTLASDAQGPRPESFYKIESAQLYASRRF
ncbi:MAG: capsule assembly Wzi family protein [Gammaproteobacteria bacterium]